MAGSAGQALEKITGQRFGLDREAWHRWWRQAGDDFLAGNQAPR
ncbi:MAG TPA: hypothetical protein VI078_05460 [bacterium]